MPGLAKWGRRADMSGVRVGDGFGEFVREVREDPEMRGGCNGRSPGSSKGTGTGIIREGGEGVIEELEDEKERERDHGGVFESSRWFALQWSSESGRTVINSLAIDKGEITWLCPVVTDSLLKQKTWGKSRGLEMGRAYLIITTDQAAPSGAESSCPQPSGIDRELLPRSPLLSPPSAVGLMAHNSLGQPNSSNFPREIPMEVI